MDQRRLEQGVDQRRPEQGVNQRRSVRITDRDREILAFAAEHRVILAEHVEAQLAITVGAASKRLSALAQAGYLRREDNVPGPSAYLIDRPGLRAIGSELPRPRDHAAGSYEHDLGLAWVWLAARAGAFGELETLTSERAMRSHDGRRRAPTEQPLGVRIGGAGPHGGQRRHYPDMLLQTSSGHRVAVELELTCKGRRRLEEILGAYSIDPRIDAVLYLVKDRGTGDAIRRAATALGISQLVHVQQVRLDPAPRPQPAGRNAARSGQRAAARSGQRAARADQRATAGAELAR